MIKQWYNRTVESRSSSRFDNQARSVSGNPASIAFDHLCGYIESHVKRVDLLWLEQEVIHVS